MMRPPVSIRRRLVAAGLLLWALAAAPVAGAIELAQVIDAAVGVDPAVASARATLEAAEQAVEVASGRLRPQVTLQSTQQHLEQTTNGRATVSEFTGRTSNTQLTLRQGLLRPRDRASVDIAEMQRQQARHRVDIALNEASARAAAVWVDVITARTNLKVRAEAVRSVGEMLSQARAKLRAGDGTQDEVARLAGELADNRGQEQETALELKARLAVFAEATGLPAASFADGLLPPIERLPQLPEWETDVWDQAVTAHPQVAAARLDEAIAERRLATTRTDHWPTLDLIAGRTEAANDSTNTLGQSYRSTSVGVQMVLPIYAGGSLAAATRQASAARVAAGADTAAVVQNLRNQLVGDWHTHRGLAARIEGAQAQVDAATAQLAAQRAHVKAGSRTLADLASAEQLVSKRVGERNTLVGLYLRTSARLVTQLPAGSPARLAWLRQLDSAAGR